MKIATVCPPSSPLFISMVEPVLRAAGHEVRRFDDTHALAADAWGDVVWAEWAGAHAVELSRFGTKPLVVRMLGYEVWEPAFREINWARVSCLVHACAAHIESARALVPALRNVRTVKTDSPLDFDRFALQPHGNGKRIGMVGQKDARKNLWGALQVLALLPADYTLDVAGDCEDGRLWDGIQHGLDAMGLRDRVTFHGRVDDLVPWWAPIDYCLVPSTHDQGPRSLAEAMALGVMPVIHNYPAARNKAPEGHVWTGVLDASWMIRDGYKMSPAEYRAWIYNGRKNPDRIRAALLAAVGGA